jgi:hypothetical protein
MPPDSACQPPWTRISGQFFTPNVIYYVLVAGTLSPIFIPIVLDESGESHEVG